MARIPERELAELAPCTTEHVCRLEELRLLERGDDGLFPSSDVHVVRLMAAFEAAGIALEDVARGVATGDLSFPLDLFLPEPVGAPETYEQLSLRGRIVLPVGTLMDQSLAVVVRSPEGPAVLRSVPCRFVPLLGREGF